MTHELKGMLWGAVLVSCSGNGKWLLLEQSISDNPMDTVESTEAAWEKPWSNLQRLGVCMIRLNLADDGTPTDMMFAWGQEPDDEIDGILPYDEEFEKLNTNLVETTI